MKAPTLILLVRHALTATTGTVLTGRAPGLHLSDDGRRQAEAVARRLAAHPKIEAIYASPLERARETAAAIAKARGCAVRIERELTELDLGAWTGRSLRRLSRKPEWQVVQRHPSGFRFPGGESFVEMQARVTGVLARLVERHPGVVVVAVSHAAPMHLDLFQRIVIAPASITAIAYRSQSPLVLTLNSMDGDLAGLLA